MNKFFSLIIIASFYFSPVFGENKIYFIDLDYLLNNSNLGKIIYKDLDSFKKKYSNKLDLMEKDLISQENKIKSMKNISPEEEYIKNVQLLKNNIVLYNKEKEKLTISFNNEKNKQMKKFIETIQPIVETYMNENQIDFLIEKKNIFIGKSTYEITNDINKLLNLKFE